MGTSGGAPSTEGELDSAGRVQCRANLPLPTPPWHPGGAINRLHLGDAQTQCACIHVHPAQSKHAQLSNSQPISRPPTHPPTAHPRTPSPASRRAPAWPPRSSSCGRTRSVKKRGAAGTGVGERMHAKRAAQRRSHTAPDTPPRPTRGARLGAPGRQAAARLQEASFLLLVRHVGHILVGLLRGGEATANSSA